MSLHHFIVKQLLAGPMSLADLQSATPVSLPTLRKAVQELTEREWICVVGQAEANGGRPAMLFGPDTRRFMVIGAHLQLPGMRLIATDLVGNILEETTRFDGETPTPGAGARAIADYVAQIQLLWPARTLLGVGVATPGFIDLNTGDIKAIGRVPGWENFPICRQLQAQIGLPVRIANDVDCMAFAEFQYDIHAVDKNLAYVGFDEGVKVSLFLKGELYQGALGNAGLIAPDLLRMGESSASPVEGGAVKRLLTIVGVNELFRARLHALPAEARAPYAGMNAAATPRERLQLILSATDEALPLCHALVDEVIGALAVAVANVALIMQPEVIVVGGILTFLPPARFADLEMAIRAYLPPLISNNTLIRLGALATQNSAALGATHHFLQDYLNDPATARAF